MFHDRSEAAIMLAKKLEKYRGDECIIMAIPQGGVSIGYFLSKQLLFPLELILTKKIGHPYNKKFAVGSVCLYGFTIDEQVAVPKDYILSETRRIQKLLKVKYKVYAGERQPVDIKNKTIIITDEGIVTGNTIFPIIDILRKSDPAKIVIATPVIPYERLEEVMRYADDLVYIIAPYDFSGIGQFYENFQPITDEKVIFLLKEAYNRIVTGKNG